MQNLPVLQRKSVQILPAKFTILLLLNTISLLLDGKTSPNTGKKLEAVLQAYAEARSTLQPVLQQCAPTLDWLEIDWIRNDLALTAYKLGDTAWCKELLRTVSVDANKTDDELRNDYPPTDFDNVMPIVKATRTNMKLCQGR